MFLFKYNVYKYISFRFKRIYESILQLISLVPFRIVCAVLFTPPLLKPKKHIYNLPLQISEIDAVLEYRIVKLTQTNVHITRAGLF